MAGTQQHSVTLLAPSGREQAVILDIARDGVRLLTVEGRDINTFAYEAIRKWLPSHLRTKNPGTDDCLDLQIETDKGPRDLRMRCSSPATVKQIMRELRDMVELIMRDLDDYQIRQADLGQSGGGASETPARGFGYRRSDAGTQTPGAQEQEPPGPATYQSRALPADAAATAASEAAPSAAAAQPSQPAPPQQHQEATGLKAHFQEIEGQFEQMGGQFKDMLSGVAQLFVAHPTHVGLPVTGRGVATPALAQGLAAASAVSPMGYEYLDTYGGDAELEVTSRAPSAAPGFFNTLYSARAGLPGFGGEQPQPTPAAVPIGVVVQQPGREGAQPLQPLVMVPLQQAQQYQEAADGAVSPRGSRNPRRKVEFRDEVDSDEGGEGGRGRSLGRGGGGSGGGSGDEGALKQQVRWLEDLVARLSTEVGRRSVSPERAAAAAMALSGAGDAAAASQQQQPSAPVAPFIPISSLGAQQAQPRAAPPPPPPVDIDALLGADALGAAAVLRDQKLLTPLLGAYDSRIASLEAELRSRTEQLQAIKAQVDEVVEENDTLRADLARASEARDLAQAAAAQASAQAAAAQAAAAAAQAAAPPPGSSHAAEELELLKQENELLVAQQAELDGEIQRLHRQLQERSQEVMRHGQEMAAMTAGAQQAGARAQDAEGRASKLSESLRSAEAKIASLSAQATRFKALADEQAAAASSTKAALEELRAAHGQLQLEAAAAQQRYKVAADGAASCQLELSTQRERNDALAGQVSALTRECDTLRSALGGVEAKLQELQRKDVDVWSRVKEALSAAEEARLARDGALSRCSDLERQVELANTRLSSVRQATRDAVVDEFSSQVAATQAAAAQVREELNAAHAALSEWRTRAERLERDNSSLQAELGTLREDTAATLASKGRLGLASLGAMEKVAQVERERDEAIAKWESAQRRAERAAREAALERQTYENTVRGLKSTVAELEAHTSALRAEAAIARRQQEAVGRELAAARQARSQVEGELRQQIAAVRSERDAEVRALSTRLDNAAVTAASAAAEAERLLAAKQEVLARWREEAQTLASRMEGALSDHKREVAARAAEAAELRQRCEALASENLELAGAVSELEGKLDELQQQLAEADARADAAVQQAMGGANREADLQQELRSLQALLDRTAYEKSRMQRAHDPLTAKYDALKKDIRQMPTAGGQQVGGGGGAAQPGMHAGQGAGQGAWGGSPVDAVVHAVRAPRAGGQQPGR